MLISSMYCLLMQSDTQWVTDRLSSELELLRLNQNRQSRVATAVTRLREHLYKYVALLFACLFVCFTDGIQFIAILLIDTREMSVRH